jgi:hypothetical protein
MDRSGRADPAERDATGGIADGGMEMIVTPELGDDVA